MPRRKQPKAADSLSADEPAPAPPTLEAQVAALAAKQNETHELLERIAHAKRRQTCLGYVWMFVQIALFCGAIGVSIYVSLAMTTLVGTQARSHRDVTMLVERLTQMAEVHDASVGEVRKFVRKYGGTLREQRALMYAFATSAVERAVESAEYIEHEKRILLYKQILGMLTKSYDELQNETARVE